MLCKLLALLNAEAEVFFSPFNLRTHRRCPKFTSLVSRRWVDKRVITHVEYTTIDCHFVETRPKKKHHNGVEGVFHPFSWGAMCNENSKLFCFVLNSRKKETCMDYILFRGNRFLSDSWIELVSRATGYLCKIQRFSDCLIQQKCSSDRFPVIFVDISRVTVRRGWDVNMFLFLLGEFFEPSFVLHPLFAPFP